MHLLWSRQTYFFTRHLEDIHWSSLMRHKASMRLQLTLASLLGRHSSVPEPGYSRRHHHCRLLMFNEFYHSSFILKHYPFVFLQHGKIRTPERCYRPLSPMHESRSSETSCKMFVYTTYIKDTNNNHRKIETTFEHSPGITHVALLKLKPPKLMIAQK
jgi:hypothetical protein